MFKQKCISALLGVLLVSANAVAFAGPLFSVTVNNGLTTDMTYTPTGVNDASTSANASPKPQPTIKVSGHDFFNVSNPFPTGGHANVTYTSGSKKCQFAVGVVIISVGPTQGSTWSQNGNSTGSTPATCLVTRTTTNITTDDATITFTMK